MIDDSYAAALERAPVPHQVLLGPLPCGGCGRAVEWAGLDWLAAGTTERHQCDKPMQPYLRQAFAGLTSVRPSQAYGVMQAHPWGAVADRKPEWWEHRRDLSVTAADERRALYVALAMFALAVLAMILWPWP